MYVFLIFFYFLREETNEDRSVVHSWKITEIKAESENY